MSFFNPEIPKKQREHSRHPWENRIKDIYSHTYKYGHNSAKNPSFLPKTKISVKGLVKFTVIGNILTKEFIYCVNLVKGLHKYRQKEFKAPVIRGVTSVEWPNVWNNLKIQYGGTSHCLTSQVAILMDDKFLGGEDELKAIIESKYIYYFHLDYHKEGLQQFANFYKSSGRPFAYLQISVDDVQIGTLIFMLYADIVPNTCENFLRLCETTKGGYGGTPIHRIVEDCWIQGGGFALKSSNLVCENFIVPHDRRGVLCMANNGRHIDCSTQFFVLLQPAPWMEYKYVAFGQLVEGEETLKKIEKVRTWYESPLSKIIIYKTGVFNMECHNVPINKTTHAYLHSHIEDLFTIGKMFYEELLEKVFSIIESKLAKQYEEGAEEENDVKNIHETQRFMHKKEELEKQSQNKAPSENSEENKEYDVDVYQYEFECTYSYSKVSVQSIIVDPEKPFYLPFTDVPYPGEVDSTYDLKKLLKGDYCLESDLEKDPAVRRRQQSLANAGLSIPYYVRDALLEDYEDNESELSLDSNDKLDIEEYLNENSDKVSFAGPIVSNIAHIGKRIYEILEETENNTMNHLLSDEELRILRLAIKECKSARDKKVSICVTNNKGDDQRKIKRRQTGYVRTVDIGKIHVVHRSEDDLDEEDEELIRTAAPTGLSSEPNHRVGRPSEPIHRQSTLHRLYDDTLVDSDDDEGPTLKDFKPVSEMQPKNFMLTHSPTEMLKDDWRDKHRRLSHFEDRSINDVLCLQHGKQVSRKISSDYVKTIEHIEHNMETSVKSFEFGKSRPSMSVAQYQLKNQKYKEELAAKSVLHSQSKTG